jgi:hypothetical protein
MPAHMKALRTVGVPYTDEQIAGRVDEVKGKTELDATIAYLQSGPGAQVRQEHIHHGHQHLAFHQPPSPALHGFHRHCGLVGLVKGVAPRDFEQAANLPFEQD